MATVQGPLLSLAASGTIGEVLTASSLRGRGVMRANIHHHQAWSQAQRSHYAKLSFLKRAWKLMPIHFPSDSQAAWIPVGIELGLPAYQAFIKTGYARFNATTAPQIVPGGGANASGAAIPSSIRTGKGFFGFNVTHSSSTNDFGSAIFLSNAPVVSRNMLELAFVIVNKRTAPFFERLQITHLAPGQYWYRGYRFGTNGTWGASVASGGPFTVT